MSFAASIQYRGLEHQSGVLDVFISISTDITTGMRDFEVMSDKLQVAYVQEARQYCDQVDGNRGFDSRWCHWNFSLK
jgi:hypothetical protein